MQPLSQLTIDLMVEFGKEELHLLLHARQRQAVQTDPLRATRSHEEEGRARPQRETETRGYLPERGLDLYGYSERVFPPLLRRELDHDC